MDKGRPGHLDVTLEEGRVRRAYDFYSPVYDFVFKKIFEPGRVAAIRLIGPALAGRVLEVGIGTGLNLPFYPRDMNLVGIDLSEGTLKRAQEKVEALRMPNVILKMMDASAFLDRKSTRLNSSHVAISYAVFCLKKKKKDKH